LLDEFESALQVIHLFSHLLSVFILGLHRMTFQPLQDANDTEPAPRETITPREAIAAGDGHLW
jgi:hypothetical protein